MSWFVVDDHFLDHPKVVQLHQETALASLGLWTLAGTWSMRQLTDGFVPLGLLGRLGGSPTLAAELVRVVLWSEVGPDGADGFQFVDWLDWQKSREEVLTKRDSEKNRKAAQRRVAKLSFPRPSGRPHGRDALSASPSPSPSPESSSLRSEDPPTPVVFSAGHIQLFRDTLAAEAMLLGWTVSPELPHSQLRQVAERAQRLSSASRRPFDACARELARSGLNAARGGARPLGLALLEVDPGAPPWVAKAGQTARARATTARDFEHEPDLDQQEGSLT